MGYVLAQVIKSGDFFWIVCGIIAIVAIVFSIVGNTIKAVSREKTRREIAAYIAEGSMSPEQGEKLMKAGPKDDDN
ncbi:MAG: hypothetical protein KIT54_04785 [Phycisphaeraceae bacterium]|nr:hypothetical protein [Phycisphaeraceae bacterium]